MALRFVGVSTGRAGSMFTARVMDTAGIPTSHEQHFNALRYNPGPGEWRRAEVGEWSAQAVPFLAELGDVWVFHQVRDPLRVIGSYLEFHDLLTHPGRLGAQGTLMATHAGFPQYGPVEDAIKLYVIWNRMCHTGGRYVRWRVEDLQAGLISALGDLVGKPVDLIDAHAAMDAYPKDLNSRGANRDLDWADLPDFYWTEELEAMATEYGYR